MSTLTAVEIARLLERDPPTPDQVRIIEAPLEPLLVVAGAGSGKTETMAARVVWLIANGHVAPHEVLGLTFTRKAAAELGDRVRLRLRRLLRAVPGAGLALPASLRTTEGSAAGADGASPGAGAVTGRGLDLARPTVSTYNSYAASIVTDHALRLGIEPTSRLLGEAGQWQLAHAVVESWAGDLETEAATSTLVDAVLSLSGALAEHLCTPAQARSVIEDLAAALLEIPDAPRKKGPYAEVAALVRSLGERARLLDVVEAYHRRKRVADVIDFGDQVTIAARLAREVDAVGLTERSRFRVVLLDEYQDTSHAQLELLSALFGGGHPVTAVGDPHQSIYGWRGASAGGLERFPERFPRVVDGRTAPAEVRYLSTSWRNDHAVLAAANAVAGPLRAPRRDPGAPDVARLVDVPPLVAAPRAAAGTVRSVYPATVEQEAAAVAQFVADRWRPAGRGPGGGRVTAAVLCRKRSQFDALEVALRGAGLPVEVVGLGGLLHTPEVVDLVSVLRVAHDPSRGDALMRLLTGARVQLGAADLHALGHWAGELARAHGAGSADRASADRGAAVDRTDDPGGDVALDAGGAVLVEGDVVDERSIVDALDDLPPRAWRSHTGRSLTDAARDRLEDLAGLLRTLRSHTYLSLPELVGEAERLLGLDIEVAARPGVSPGRARAHLDAFRDVAVQFSDGADAPTLGAFLAWIDAAAREERGLDRPVTEPDPDAVQLITIHAAKGLEWDVVAVAGMTDGVLPATSTTGPHGPAAGGWLTGLGVLPYPLRGDADELPVLVIDDAVDQKELESRRKQFRRDVGAHEVAEERRLAYVALTRARSALLLSGSWWRDRKEPQPPSAFLQELVRAGLVQPDGWAAEPGLGAVNPRTAEPVTHTWPTDPFGAGPRRARVVAAAAAVRSALAVLPEEGERGSSAGPAEQAGSRDGAGPDPADPAAAGPGLGAEMSLRRTAELLLAERDRLREPRADVPLPPHLSASAVVRLAADRAAFAEALRRPVPLEPSVQARRGTDFHAWVERYFGSASLVDVEALPGADDDSVPVDAGGAELRARFLATPWAAMRPRAVEVDIETPVAGYVLRCRVDAVFDGPDGRVTVVDWKTGRPPADAVAARAREVQLAVYRLAWSRWSGTPIDRVDAAFCYVGTGQTVTPERLLDESEIEALLEEASTG
ncbi:ATP-dependent DNA helicase [uncultured Cellulomonas sp.]|uniref:ATP-dependent DNA helicase n=1 Tax=uncultured Cellulomonas sp. TaxID=189682 RepID=UPI00261F8DF0|nr:ATP-dependent DNA helicase [uncultured Cellulomonas sp.]